MKNIKNRFKAVLFDMDGTIIKSEHIWQEANLVLLKNKGFETFTSHQQAVLDSFSGIGLIPSVTKLKEAFNLSESVEELINQKQAITATLFDEHAIEFIDGFENFHSVLREHEILSCVATNADEHFLGKISERLNFQKFFGENLFSISHIGNKAKPDPAIFLHAAEKLGVQPSECIVFEDSLFGFMAAKAAGMKCIAIQSSTNMDKLHHVDHSIESYHHALEALNKVASKK